MRKLAVLTVAIAPLLGAEAVPNFAEHIAPILFENCASCHRQGEAGPFPLTSYAEAAKRGKLIAAITRARIMPPWHAEKTHYEFANERRLSEEQIVTIERWVKAGMPEGDRSKQPPLPAFTEGWELGKPDLELKMDRAFRVPAEGPDIYRYFALPVNLDEDRWVRAIEFRPGRRSVVHHALIFIDDQPRPVSAKESGSQPGFDQFPSRGGMRNRVATWALGTNPRLLPDGLAVKLPKGSQIVVQTHFHPSGKEEDEISSVGLHFADAPPARSIAEIHLPPFFGISAAIDIPAGDPAYSLTESFVTPVDVEAFAVFAHAHYIGKEFRLTAELPDGDSRDLLWIKRWDFAWQTLYHFKEPLVLPKGTKITSRIVWDNSDSNPKNPFRPARRIQWGENSEDEMGSLVLDVAPIREEDMLELRNALARHSMLSQARALLAREGVLADGIAGLKPPEQKLAQFILSQYDADGDGKLGPAELEAARAFLREAGFDVGRRRSSLGE